MADNALLPLDVVIPCYNAEKTLQRAVDSVLNQSAVHRLYLIDDGSQDRTWQLIQQLAARSGRISALQMTLTKTKP
ncbi:Glycosyltransferases involved in cell wall biogenesis [Pasteurella testudinis DSM 23072]|uniref:Glycosyltransferases involved in cell wall biogenesis n=1 Tax=Pasteurella testudinis DSM 23072 TaxID=1122938 RepID=A0A1W1URI4_9PAST|nr:Glycosyltransferases involved in cell wall biogenesis [Pasteurella testudinis DSM 23072]